MNYLAVAVAGASVLLLTTWIVLLAMGRAAGQVRLSTDERLALQRAHEVSKALAESGLPAMGRREIWHRSTAIWRSVRATALHSGRWTVLPWLFLFGLLCLLVSIKTIIAPAAHDLRILLAGREFVDFFLASRRDRRPARSAAKSS